MVKRELELAVRKFKNKKAPGEEGIKAEVLKCVGGGLRERMARLLLMMWREGEFPDIWKKGVVKLIKKGDRKPNEEVKSYRPVTLLPVLGKWTERVLAGWLMNEVGERISTKQYGFKKGVGTVQALGRLKRCVEEAEGKYVCGIFADIKGAFDNAWHVEILRTLQRWGCATGLVKIIESYLSGRVVKLKVGGGEAVKVVKKGCPQGSILGPLLWNILFNGLLELDMGESEVIAYADDAVVVVQGETRNEVERRLCEVAEALWSWTEGVKLELSVAKTVVMKLRVRKENVGKRQKSKDDTRKMVVRVRGRRVESVRDVRYLGVRIEEGMKCEKHVAEVGTKVLEVMSAFSRQMKVEGGLVYSTMYKLYRSVVEPGMLYGMEFWGHEMLRRQGLRKKWNAMQRRVLLKMLSAYRTVSTDAACVLAGVEPLDLRVEMGMRVAEDVERGEEKKESRERRASEMMMKWRERWETSLKGRVTFGYMESVRIGGSKDWSLDYYVTQALTGHGNFKEKLSGFGLGEDGRCTWCGEGETIEHVIFVCAKYEEERGEMRERIRRDGGNWERKEVVKDEYREEFFGVVRNILRKKEVLEETVEENE